MIWNAAMGDEITPSIFVIACRQLTRTIGMLRRRTRMSTLFRRRTRS